MIKVPTPAAVNAPWLGALISRMKSANATPKNNRPNQLTERKPIPYTANPTQITPIKPATQPPGLEISIRIAWTPMARSRNRMLGLVRMIRICSIKVGLMGIGAAWRVWRRYSPASVLTVNPSNWVNRLFRSLAMKSINPTVIASWAVTAMALSMVCSARRTASGPRWEA